MGLVALRGRGGWGGDAAVLEVAAGLIDLEKFRLISYIQTGFVSGRVVGCYDRCRWWRDCRLV